VRSALRRQLIKCLYKNGSTGVSAASHPRRTVNNGVDLAKSHYAWCTAGSAEQGVGKAGATLAELLVLKRLAPGGAAWGETEIVSRSMTHTELDATHETGLVRGGRAGEHVATNDVYGSAEEAQTKLALPGLPDLVADLEAPRGAFSPASRVKPASGFPGGGTERTANGRVPARVASHRYYSGGQ